ncbi:MAG: diaminopimelate epimerase [Pseudomonadota bacterium]
MILPFTKMQSLGNDFVVIDGIGNRVPVGKDFAARIADRRFGIGCDQILLVEEGDHNADFKFRIFNQDGSEVGQCGNGARCFARYVVDNNLWHRDTMTAKTLTTSIRMVLEDDGTVSVDMGAPVFDPDSIPLNADNEQTGYDFVSTQGSVKFGAVSMGNPHAVIEVEDVGTAPVGRLGAELQQSSIFPESVNVGFMAMQSRNCIDLRVFERGVGETMGCGSGACAAVVYGISTGKLSPSVTVNLPGGAAVVSWDGRGSAVTLRGSAETVFEGEIDVSEFAAS